MSEHSGEARQGPAGIVPAKIFLAGVQLACAAILLN